MWGSPTDTAAFPAGAFDVVYDNNGKDLDACKPLIDHFKVGTEGGGSWWWWCGGGAECCMGDNNGKDVDACKPLLIDHFKVHTGKAEGDVSNQSGAGTRAGT